MAARRVEKPPFPAGHLLSVERLQGEAISAQTARNGGSSHAAVRPVAGWPFVLNLSISSPSITAANCLWRAMVICGA